MKQVLVTGATGGLGRNAVAMLLQRGCRVRATGRKLDIGRQLVAQGAEFLQLDLALATRAEMAGLLHGIDTVWHCAALSAPWGAEADFISANVQATERLLQAAGRAGVSRFVHISTPALYFDFQHRRQIPESYRPRHYVNAYARSKAQAEDKVQQAVVRYPGMRCIILRPRAIFGEYDQVLIPRLARLLRRPGARLPLPRGGAVLLDLTYVGNVTHAMWLASCQPGLVSGEVFNITNQQPAVLKQVLQQLFVEELGWPMRIVSPPYSVLHYASQVLQWLSRLSGREPVITPYSLGAVHFDMTLDNHRACERLGYVPPYSMQEGIQRTADWLREQRLREQADGQIA